MQKILRKEKLTEFLEYLEVRYDVYALAKSGGEHEYHYEKVTARDYSYTIGISEVTPKHFFLPASHEMFKALGTSSKKKVIFGVHYFDIEAISLLDKAFKFPITDQEFFTLKEKVIIIGMDYTPAPKEGHDLYLQILEDEYAVTAGSGVGARLAKLKFFEEAKAHPKKDSCQTEDVVKDSRLAAAIRESKDSKIWDDLSKRCFGCGTCSYVCPVCYCFDIKDTFDLKGNAKRERCWDSCMLSNFATIAGGYDFRPELRNRIYNWYYHKFVRMPKELKRVGCVGCSRCVSFCPARINIREVLSDVLKEYEKKHAKKFILSK
ncbi:TPA: hypothetical protein DDW69_04490 [candidate division CPR2 bacterium]|uniref:4Fe-4S ferredoxin-type domain-containing protein n=1 Tax=candidate division CPR2 bacterium GW2011_GWC1_41_48 TaxID=1618344 RepID=A0A0G0WB58_UNCC2|nr:MAG: hypothetical protein UT47_C0002G0224 [candidate division CPR2 bacterium GW2011_GWC2_39_35]KKR28335.1 MAG: hypothetical protein UT59_C0030G0010 [candidate division CPR2 bacterium GW2011_GWD1_39_7]KKR29082.1 MAG: hypothetical protein UT60_C0007G0027 [candidate division CPR2 bacterium GW2011_GWD2_39_7]KKS09302.1 MAG: hypothetical protein UU65_C0002G0080 [candidate division CPR2 bacterium GW2011_GWC1_41_48]OGB60577.1 MAG: hypothetical protein A2Y27_01700 [candidate division CPR2 bacterium G